MGAKVVMLEGHKMGGDCLNFGCVPSKALIAAGKQAHTLKTGEPFGVAPVEPVVDYAAAKDHVAKVPSPPSSPTTARSGLRGSGCM